MADEPLTAHPTTGRPVRRLLQPPGLTLKAGGSKASLDDGNLARLGFTKYQKASDGKYEKTVGTGPDIIRCVRLSGTLRPSSRRRAGHRSAGSTRWAGRSGRGHSVSGSMPSDWGRSSARSAGV